jgi:hypothetical protein
VLNIISIKINGIFLFIVLKYAKVKIHKKGLKSIYEFPNNVYEFPNGKKSKKKRLQNSVTSFGGYNHELMI